MGESGWRWEALSKYRISNKEEVRQQKKKERHLGMKIRKKNQGRQLGKIMFKYRSRGEIIREAQGFEIRKMVNVKCF